MQEGVNFQLVHGKTKLTRLGRLFSLHQERQQSSSIKTSKENLRQSLPTFCGASFGLKRLYIVNFTRVHGIWLRSLERLHFLSQS